MTVVPVKEVSERQSKQGKPDKQQPEADRPPAGSCGSDPQPHDVEGFGAQRFAQTCLGILILNFGSTLKLIAFHQSHEIIQKIEKE